MLVNARDAEASRRMAAAATPATAICLGSACAETTLHATVRGC